MPSIRSSARPNTGGWTQAQTPSAAAQNTAQAPPPDPFARNPFMTASMPLMASTGDAFARQFYTDSGLPQQRILPAKKGGGA
jgi:hypothetical protein